MAGIILNSSVRKGDIPTEAVARRSFPLTYAYLLTMRPWAIQREQFWQFFSRKHRSANRLTDEEMKAMGAYVRAVAESTDGLHAYEIADGPFFSLFNVGAYTFAPYKVCWPMGASQMRASVAGDFAFSTTGGTTQRRTIVPATGTTSYVSFEVEEPAHFLCGLLNSLPVSAYIRSFSSAGRGFGAPSIVGKLRLPAYNPESGSHRRLVELSRDCHAAVRDGKAAELPDIEHSVDTVAASLWDITVAELDLLRTEAPKRKANHAAGVAQEDEM